MAEVLKDWEAFEIVALPLAGAEPARGLKRGRPVSAGELLARAADPARGHLHAPVAGFLEGVRAGEIVIRRDEAAVGEPPRPAVLSGLPPAELGRALRELGLDLAGPPAGETFVVSALDPEPGLAFVRPLLAEHRETLAAGLAALKNLYPGVRLIWAGARPEEAPAGADEFRRPRADYPWTLPALVARGLTGSRDRVWLGGAADLRRLFDLGRLWRTGLPLRRMILTLGRATYFVPPGARPADLLASAHLEPRPGDAVVAGGLIRGRTLARLTRGLGRETHGLHLVRRAGSGWAGPCRRCGECLRACPEGPPVAACFARGSDGGLLGSGEPGEIMENCWECGACALACPARRPLLAWARLRRSQGPG